MYLDFEGKKITFDKYVIDLSGLAAAGGDLNKFIADTFANLGAELIENSKYGLYFTLDPAKNPNYSPIIDNLIIKDGQYLKLKLDKTKDLVQDGGLGLDGETPTDPEEPEEPVIVPVESVAISGQPANVVHGGAPFKLTASVLPDNATNKAVTWSSSHPEYISVDNQGNVTIKDYTAETITITLTSNADSKKTASWQFNIQKAAVTNIIVNPETLNMQLRNDDIAVEANITTAIEPAIATSYTPVTFQADESGTVSVDNNGKVTALKEGTAVITVTAGGLTKQVNVTVEPAPVLEYPVTGITVTSPAKVYQTNSNITIDFEITPANTTDPIVSYTISNGQSGSITTSNGKGTLTIADVTANGTVTFTTLKNHTATYELQVVKEVTSINFENTNVVKEQGTVFTNNIADYDTISNSIASWTYSSDDENIASVDSTTGQVTAKKNGMTTIRVTAQPKYDAEPLHAEFKIDVLGHIDYTDETSLQGTYDIVFFGTNSNGTTTPFVGTAAILQTNCAWYNFLWGSDNCKSGGLGDEEIDMSNFAGRAVINIVNGTLKVHTKVAFKGGSLVQSFAANDQYQYTVYNDASLNTWLDTNYIGNMPGRNLTATTTPKNPKYYFEQNKVYPNNNSALDIVLFTHFEDKEITVLGSKKYVNPDTRLVLRKVSSQVNMDAMDPNSLSVAPFNKIDLSLNDVGYNAPSIN